VPPARVGLIHSRSQIIDELKSGLFERRSSPSAGKFVPETNLVDVHMGRLRRKVGASSNPPRISNVRGVGFIHRVAFGSAYRS